MINVDIKENIGIIYLNRPKVINSLNYEMIEAIHKQLIGWENDNNIKAILFDSKAEKGFCAGGDLKVIYSDISQENPTDEFFIKEFAMDKYIANYNKPILSHWYGVTMGGGIGLSINSDYIIVDETVNWAMPETKLGFVPDVGVGKFIAKLPKAIGQYVGLIGRRLYPEDLVKYGLAHIYIDSKVYENVIEKLFALSKEYDGEELIKVFDKYCKGFKKEVAVSSNDIDMEKIEKYFNKDSLVEIYEGLKEASADEFANGVLNDFEQRNLFMIATQFEKYFACKSLSYEEVLDLDLEIIRYGIKNSTMIEGIRSQIIDKDKNPKWKEKALCDVYMEKVESFFRE